MSAIITTTSSCYGKAKIIHNYVQEFACSVEDALEILDNLITNVKTRVMQRIGCTDSAAQDAMEWAMDTNPAGCFASEVFVEELSTQYHRQGDAEKAKRFQQMELRYRAKSLGVFGASLIAVVHNIIANHEQYIASHPDLSDRYSTSRSDIIAKLRSTVSSDDAITECISMTEKPMSALGICSGMVMQFIMMSYQDIQSLSGQDLHQRLLEHAQTFARSLTADAIALTSMLTALRLNEQFHAESDRPYIRFNRLLYDVGASSDHPLSSMSMSAPEIQSILPPGYDSITIMVDRCRKMGKRAAEILYSVHGLDYTDVACLAHLDRSLARPERISDKDYLALWWQDGGNGYFVCDLLYLGKDLEVLFHQIAFIRKNQDLYILDPNFGLIKCSQNPQQQIETIGLLLEKYYPIPINSYPFSIEGHQIFEIKQIRQPACF